MAGPTLFRPSSITSGLQGYWKFDNNANDSSSNGYNLTTAGTPTYPSTDYWKTGEQSIALNGTTQWAVIANASCPNLQFTSSFTFVFTLKQTSFPGNSVLISKYNGSTTGYEIRTDGGLLNLDLNTTSVNTGSAVITALKAHICAVVYDDTNDVVNFYVDGNLVKSSAASLSLSNATDEFCVGARSTGHGFSTPATFLKDLAAWNVALTPIQIKSLSSGVDQSLYAYRPNNVSTQPTAWWKLNELSGNALDSIGSLNGTDTNTVASLGGYIEGVGRDFEDASSEYFSIADNTAFDFSGGIFSFGTWLKREVAGDQHSVFTVRTDANNFFRIAITASNLVQVSIFSGGAPAMVLDGAITLTAGTWYQVFVTENSNTWTIYIDGVADSGASFSAGNGTQRCANYTGDAYIGGDQTPGSNTFDGVMCDMAIWKGYVVTAAEIKSLACGIPLQQTGIVSYYKLDETSGTRADSIGANTLTDNNTVLSGTGKVSNAADFEASASEYLSSADSADLDFGTDGMSILCWLNPESLGAGEYAIARGTSPDFGLLVSSGGLNFYIEGGVAATYGTPISVGSYSHLALVRDGANARIILNSAQVATGANTSDIQGTTGLNLGASGTPSNYYDGLMDEFVIAKRWFRDEEIKTIYCKGLCGKELTSGEIQLGGNQVIWFL